MKRAPTHRQQVTTAIREMRVADRLDLARKRAAERVFVKLLRQIASDDTGVMWAECAEALFPHINTNELTPVHEAGVNIVFRRLRDMARDTIRVVQS